jgi:hypothetical protein
MGGARKEKKKSLEQLLHYYNYKPELNSKRAFSKTSEVYIHIAIFFFKFWFVRLLALRPLLAYCASFG